MSDNDVYDFKGRPIYRPEWGVAYQPDDEGYTLSLMLAFKMMALDHPLVRDLSDEEKLDLRDKLVAERKERIAQIDAEHRAAQLKCLAWPVRMGWIWFCHCQECRF